MTRSRGWLEWDTFETVVAKIREHVKGARFSLSFSGMGEPLLHPLLPRFIRQVSTDATTAFSTNGLALTPRNTEELIEAGLDVLYLSFNGDEPGLFKKMMGGLVFDHVLRNLRQAVAMSRGSRLRINANVSVTKANRHRLTQIRQLLQNEGITGITYSMCHARGGNLRDPEVFDTPPIPEEVDHCDVIRGTLFIDWQGKAFICDHDVHGEHCLGDLLAEPISAVLERRESLVREGVRFGICGQCNDALKMGFHIFPEDIGGILPDWIYDVYRDDPGDALADAGPHMKWLYALYEKEHRLDRMVARLISRGQDLERRSERQVNEIRGLEGRVEERDGIAKERLARLLQLEEIAKEREARVQELDQIAKERESSVLRLAAERSACRSLLLWPLIRLEMIARGKRGPRKPHSGLRERLRLDGPA